MTEATRLIISEACQREGFRLHPDTRFDNIAPGVYLFSEYAAYQPPRRRVAVVKGLIATIHNY